MNEIFDSEEALSYYLENGKFAWENVQEESLLACGDSKSLRIEKVFIQAVKESNFLGGKAEVTLLGTQSRGCNYTDRFGPKVFMHTKSTCEWLTIQSKPHLALCTSAESQFFLAANEVIGYIFYEKDKRKKWENSYNLPGCEEVLIWTSKEEEYGARWVTVISPSDINSNTAFTFQFFDDFRPNVTPGSNTCGVGKPEGAVEMWGKTN